MSDEGVLAEALAALARGEKEAMAVLYDEAGRDLYGLALWRTGNAQDAADVVQEVFVRLAQTRASLGGISKPKAYLMSMAHRAAVDLFRGRRGTVPLEEAMLLDGGAGPGERLAEREASLAVAKLTPEQREVVYLRHSCGLTFAEIGTALGISLFTAASRYRLALRRLRKALGVTPGSARSFRRASSYRLRPRRI